MKDVAERAGVSLSAVSLVLSGRRPRSISLDTRERILSIVEELGYRPNQHARSLARGSSNALGVIVSEIANPFFPEIIHAFEALAMEHGFENQLVNTEYDEQRARLAVRKMIDNNIRGVAVFTSQLPDSVIEEIVQHRIPIVSVGSTPPGPWISRIRIDYAQGIEDLLRYLVKLGHKRFAAIVGPEDVPSARAYAITLAKVAKTVGVTIQDVISCNYRHDGGMQAVHTLVAGKQVPTAILCANDLVALGAISALEQAGMSVPKDVSVVGFDDIIFARLARPPLTTSAVPRQELGKLAFEMLSKMMRLKRPKGEIRRLIPTLVVRDSAAAPRKIVAR